MMTKRIISILVTVVLITLLAAQTAAVGPISPDQEVSLELLCQSNGTALVGAEFSIYHVASVDASGNLTPTRTVEAYENFLSDLAEADWPGIVSTLEGFFLRDNVPPTDQGATDENGQLHFPRQAERLEQGLYLVTGSCHEQDGFVYEMQSFLVMLPTLDQANDVWVYHVPVKPKYTREELPEEPSEKIRVLKIWDDRGFKQERPPEIQVQLLCDGEVYDTVTLNRENSWSHIWEHLEHGHRWMIVELAPEGYKVVVTQNGSIFTVTNTKEGPPPPTEPGPPDLPNTGQLTWPIPVLIIAGLLLILAGLLRRRGSEYGF